MAVKKITPIAQ
ncbi:hypothetical protein YPPY54_4747, partial [Yersinia pestis PY-54]